MGAGDQRNESDRPEVRIADAERNAAVARLQTHFVDGRLTLDEFAERSGLAYRARTASDLAALMADLPAPARATQPDLRPASAPPPATSGRRRVVAIMSAAHRRGRWRVDRPITAVAWWGAVKLDLRGAEIAVDRVRITAWALMGSVEIVVPEGVPVDHGGFVLMGGNDTRVREVEPVPGAPTIEVRARGMWGAVAVRNPRARHVARDLAEDAEDQLGHQVAQARAQLQLQAEQARTQLEQQAGQRGRSHAGGRHQRNATRPARPTPPPIPQVPAPPARRPPVPPPGPPSTPADPAPPPISATEPHPPAPAAASPPGPSRPAAPPLGTVTVLFTDICGSTQIAEALGDQRWMAVLGDHNELVRRQVLAHGGSEVKIHGDGFMVAFGSARAALLAAMDIQRDLATYRRDHPDAPLTARIGAHTGEVVADDGDYFGRNVILAARIADHAGAGEILVSSLVKELTDSSGDLHFGDGEEVTLKGLSRPWRVHRVAWT